MIKVISLGNEKAKFLCKMREVLNVILGQKCAILWMSRFKVLWPFACLQSQSLFLFRAKYHSFGVLYFESLSNIFNLKYVNLTSIVTIKHRFQMIWGLWEPFMKQYTFGNDTWEEYITFKGAVLCLAVKVNIYLRFHGKVILGYLRFMASVGLCPWCCHVIFPLCHVRVSYFSLLMSFLNTF